MSETGTFDGCVGAEIFWQSWPVENAKAIVVLAHGLGEHSGRYEPFAKHLNNMGVSVYANDHRGHGRSFGRRGDVGRIEYCVNDLATFINDVVKPQAKPIYLFGHSMGGTIATAYSLDYQHELQGLMLSGPAVYDRILNTPLKILCIALGRVAPTLPVFKVDPGLVSRDADEVRKYREDPMVLSAPAPARTISALVRCVSEINRRFPSLNIPLLLMHGEEDKLAPKEGSESLYDAASSSDKTLKIYPDLYHEILNELPDDREKVLRDISEWLGRRLDSPK